MTAELTRPLAVPLPRARTLMHPGPFNPVRIASRSVERARHFRLRLQPGLSMYGALIDPLRSSGVRCASLTILGGWFDAMQYCVAPADVSGTAVVSYSEPISVGRSYLIFGNATVGLDQKDKLIVHCHGALVDETGTPRGGHVLTDRCIVGSEPICALVTTLDGFDLRIAFDPETNIPLIQPLDFKESSQ